MFRPPRFRVFCLCFAPVAFVLVAPAALSAQSASRPPAVYAPAKKQSLDGVANLGEVSPMLFRGGQPTSQGFRALAKLGINIVVDLRRKNSIAEQREKQEVTSDGMRFVSLPWDCHHPSDEMAARFLEILRDNPGKKLFVHCHYGVDRTGALIAVYRMADDGWTPAEAMNEMKLFGYNILHRAWCHALVGFENNFPQQMKGDPRLRALSSRASSGHQASSREP
jgi:protein tyrosine/serine phosphatase